MVSFELGKEIEKDVFRLVPRSWQGEKRPLYYLTELKNLPSLLIYL